ncbi:MAG: ribonuclease VapC [Methanobacteriaceae archaeon]|jgi:UPF0271 protein
MQKKIYVLDASAIIGGFCSNANFTTAGVILEIKDLKSSLLLESAIKNGYIHVEEPEEEDIEKTSKIIESSGDILRLSRVDRNLIALALKLKRKGYALTVVTDDYSMQNTLKTIDMPYRTVLAEGIKEIYNWVKICVGCKKKYPSRYTFKDCEICGSPLYKKRMKLKK